MGLNRQLVDTVKKTFAQRASAELEEIVRAKDLNRWSEEAFVAACEVLADRAAGRAKEPLTPEKEQPPPSAEDRWGVLFSVLGFVGGDLVDGLLDLSQSHIVDKPVPFGSNVAWLAVETTDTTAVAAALGLRGLQEVMWEDGIASSRSTVFVTPPLGDWTLAVSAVLFPQEDVRAFVKPLLEKLSRSFREAQYFCTHRKFGLHVWARAEAGRLLRGYGWLDQKSQTLWNEGLQTEEERDLGFHFGAGLAAPVEKESGDQLATPDEGCVMQLASLWSIDPTALDEYFSEPTFGLIGNVPQRFGRT